MSSHGPVNGMEDSNSQTNWWMILALVGMVILSVCLLSLIACFRCRICLTETTGPDRASDANDPGNGAREGVARGIDEATLDSYPRMVYSEKVFRSSKSEGKGDLEAEDKSCCSICLSDYTESEVVRVMPDCGHMFHAVCIDQWLRRHATCPLCRTSPIPKSAEPCLTIVSQL